MTADIDNDKTHQNPICENGNTNYLYVDVRLESCAIPTADDYLHLYVRESHLSANWPIDWTEGYYEAGNPNTPLVGYEVTDIANNNELDPNYSQGIPMTDYASLQIERYVDANTGAEKLYKIYRYEILWVPINPSDLPDYPMDANIDVTMLARIVSPSDTMKITEVAYVPDNVRNNNNIALRSEIVISFPSSIAPEDMGTETNNAVLNIKKPDAVPGLLPSDDEYSISLTIHPLDTMAVAPLVSISDSGDGAIIAFDYLDIELELSDLLMDAWSASGLQGEGFEWVGDQRIKITSPTFAMQNLSLADNTNYRMIVSTTAIDNYREIAFSLALVDDEANTIGSQLYETQGSQFGTIILSNDDIAIDLDITQTFPNPTDDRLNIVNDKGWDRYCIHNIDGIIVQNGDLINGLNLVEVGELHEGLYIIAFRNRRGNVMTQKIVKL